MKKFFISFIMIFFIFISFVLAKNNNSIKDDLQIKSNFVKQTVVDEKATDTRKDLQELAQRPPDDMNHDDGRPDRFDRMREMIAWRYIEYLDLTEKQSVKFFPILNEFNRKRFEIMHQRQSLLNEIITNVEDESIATKDLKKKLNEIENLLESEVNEIKGFYKNTEKFLDDRQSIKLHIFEEKLKNDLFNQFRDRDRRPQRD